MNRLAQSQNYASLMFGQLIFLQSFIEDLLDLGQLKNGVFTLSFEGFDPAETFELICNTFGPQVASKKIKITFETEWDLKAPQELN